MVSRPNVYTWNAIISGHVKLGDAKRALEAYYKMQDGSVNPDKFTFSCVLKACVIVRSIGKGMLIHKEIVKCGLQSELFIGTTLVDMYAKCGRLEEARQLFDELSHRNVVTWGAMLAGYVQHGLNTDSLELFQKMQDEGLKPSKVTILCILKACGSAGAIAEGRLIHDDIVTSTLQSDSLIGNTVVDMYAKCGKLEEALKVFKELPTKNVVSWGAMITGYVQNGHGLLALALFEEMQEKHIKPDKVIFSCILKACGSIGEVEQGRCIHEQIIKIGLQSDMVVGSALVDMYAKCGSIEQARKVFDALSDQDVVTWGAMFAGYAQHTDGIPALELFKKMLEEGIKPSKVIFLCIMKACGSIGVVVQGRLVHDQIIKFGLNMDIVVGSTLIEMYAKCGSLEEATKVFDNLSNHDAVLWGAMIAGSVHSGNFKLVWQCLENMQKEGIKPVETILTSILAACSHAGLVEEGQRFFIYMTENHGFIPGVEHYSCMVDLLGRAGFLSEAEDLLQTMPRVGDAMVWTSLLSCCQAYGNVELGQRCFNQFVRWDANDASGYMLMSNIYANAQMWEEVVEIQELRKDADAWKKPGRAWVEIGKTVREFIVRCGNDPQDEEIDAKLKKLKRSMKRYGYLPQLDLMMESSLDEATEVISVGTF